MSYEMPNSSKPIFDSDLSPDLQGTFRELFHETFSINRDIASVGTASDLLRQHVEEAVSEHPVLAQTIYNDTLKWSLLEVVCAKTSLCQEFVKFLIEANPHALLWVHGDPGGSIAPIHFLAENSRNNPLLPWIVERYPWVFQHEVCQKKPPHVAMVRSWVNRRCDLEIVRTFYESYPEGLREKDGSSSTVGKYPLLVSLEGSEEPEADLFIWMAEQYPKAVYQKFNRGYTVLHMVCSSLARIQCSPNMAKICNFLISEHGGLVWQTTHCGYLPIHMLANRCNRPLVQEMAILLLKAYPECVQVKARKRHRELSTVPFIQQVYPHILKELEVGREISLLDQISQNMTKAAVSAKRGFTSTSAPASSAVNSSLLESLSEVFRSWANLRVSDVLLIRKQRIQECIADTCRRLEGDDILDEVEEEEDWIDDHASESEDEDSDIPNVIQDEYDSYDDRAYEFENEEEEDVPESCNTYHVYKFFKDEWECLPTEIEDEEDWKEHGVYENNSEGGRLPAEAEDEHDWKGDRASQFENEEDDGFPLAIEKEEENGNEDSTSECESDEDEDVHAETENEEGSYEDRASQFENEEDDDVPAETEYEGGCYEDRSSQFENEEDDDAPNEIEEEDDCNENRVSQYEDRASEFQDEGDDDVPDEVEDVDDWNEDHASDGNASDELDYAVSDGGDYHDYGDDCCEDYDDYYSDGGYSYD